MLSRRSHFSGWEDRRQLVKATTVSESAKVVTGDHSVGRLDDTGRRETESEPLRKETHIF